MAQGSGLTRGDRNRNDRIGLPGVDGLPVGMLSMPASRHVIHPSRYPELETNGRFLSGRLAVTRG